MARSTTPTAVVTFAGIDYHKKFSVVALGDEKGKVVSIERIPNDKQAIRKFFESYGKLKCAVESCRGYEWFIDLLREMGLEVHLCNGSRGKADSAQPLQGRQSRCSNFDGAPSDRFSSNMLSAFG